MTAKFGGWVLFYVASKENGAHDAIEIREQEQ